MHNLTRIDCLILTYVGKHQPVSRDDIKKRFPKYAESVEYRLSLLSRPTYSGSGIAIPDSSYLIEHHEVDPCGEVEYLGIYSLTGLGHKALQDLKQSRKASFLSELRIWVQWLVPVVISFLSLLNSIFRWLEVGE